MEDLLQVKLTNQERQHIILKSIDKEYRQRLEEEQKVYPDAMCFFSHWVVKGKDIIKFNHASKTLNSWFDFYDDEIRKFDPNLDFVMLEGERIEEGEWDKTYQRWAKSSYQRVLVLAMNTFVEKLTDEGIVSWAFKIEEDYDKDINKLHLKYPYSWEEGGKNLHPVPIGLIDIPLEMLDGYKDKQIEEQLFFGNEFYSRSKNWVLEDQKKSREKKEKRKGYKNSKRNNSSFKKAFSGGFGQ